MNQKVTVEELKQMSAQFTPHNPHGLQLTKRIDKLLMDALPDLIYEELKSIRKNDDDNKESDELQEFLGKDCHTEYCKLSPLIYRLNEMLNTLYKETPYEKYRD